MINKQSIAKERNVKAKPSDPDLHMSRWFRKLIPKFIVKNIIHMTCIEVILFCIRNNINKPINYNAYDLCTLDRLIRINDTNILVDMFNKITFTKSMYELISFENSNNNNNNKQYANSFNSNDFEILVTLEGTSNEQTTFDIDI